MSDKIEITYEVEHDCGEETIYVQFPQQDEDHVCHPPSNNIDDFVKQIAAAYLNGYESGVFTTVCKIGNKFDKFSDKIAEDLTSQVDVYNSFTVKEQP